MPCSVPRLGWTPTLPATASTCLLRPRARLLLVHGSGAAAAATLPVTAVASTDLTSSHYTSVAASPSLRASSSTGGGSGLVALTVTASAACKREAEFLEKYFDSARAKLPETMASVRLVGREIGDLAADLSDLSNILGYDIVWHILCSFCIFVNKTANVVIASISQELTKGAKSSMRIIHTAEAQLYLKPTTRPGSQSNQDDRLDEPLLASTVRHLRELIADIRSGFGTASGMTRAIMWAFNFDSKHRKNCS
ncbi:hypothetical protein PR202_gb17435 [Eleusine coracana subsp. coracana]|uniref:Uncharacterized protein n=1 Tax=Eleusine coracana subsp. coracana TaxID=191504 RepID=A0AAV5F0M7_ELECO|nr:hypothetical protein PR202_gb17435 [Eleusine coracana subsp. coracana]